MAKYQCLGSEPKSTFRVLLNLRACQGKHPKIHGPSQPGALWKAWENQWIRRLEVGVETIQYVVLIWRPRWDHRGSQRMRQRWKVATMVWQDVTSLGEPKGQKQPAPTVTNLQVLDQTLLSPDTPGKEKKKGSGKRPVLAQLLTKRKLSFKPKVS